MTHVVACICSRGLVHSRTVEAVHSNLYDCCSEGDEWDVVFTHGEPIPDAQNRVVKLALLQHPRYLWFVEEDIVPPDGCLEEMLKLESRVVSAKYRLKGGSWAHRMVDGEVLFCGLGCLLLGSSVFQILDYPWFRSDVSYDQFLQNSTGEPRRFGGQDIYFFAQLKRAGIKANVIDVECDHLYVSKFGEPGQNVGFHSIGKF